MLRSLALTILETAVIGDKVAAARTLDERLPVATAPVLTPQAAIPGREGRPVLVPPAQVPRRGLHTREGRGALLHALAHIEFNAIDLALDAVWRFPGLPEAFYRDWARVAKEEAEHFTLINDHLATLGYTYGDFPAHRGLWDMAEKTADDPLARMALVPCTMEAHGLDVSPAIRDKLVQAGDPAAGPILDLILRDEVGHVGAGLRWYRYLCAQRGLAPDEAYGALSQAYGAPRRRGPYNLTARRQAGFGEAELAALP